MTISLRPHHFLCLQGYRGYNYSRSQINSWNKISKILKENPETDVLIVRGTDDLCKNCPALTNLKSHCLVDNVNALDEKVRKLLGLVIGQVYKYCDIVKNLNEKMTQEMHALFCSGCMWWKKGLCKDSFKSEKDLK